MTERLSDNSKLDLRKQKHWLGKELVRVGKKHAKIHRQERVKEALLRSKAECLWHRTRQKSNGEEETGSP